MAVTGIVVVLGYLLPPIFDIQCMTRPRTHHSTLMSQNLADGLIDSPQDLLEWLSATKMKQTTNYKNMSKVLYSFFSRLTL